MKKLPALYTRLGEDNSDPEPSSLCWYAPSRFYADDYYHPGASREMRSFRIEGHGHQACYSADGKLIENGLGAGTADRGFSIFWKNPAIWEIADHRDLDVYPYIEALQLDGNPVVPTDIDIPKKLDNPILFYGQTNGNAEKYLKVRETITHAGTRNP